MTLKNIGVFVDATPDGEKRIDYAAALAHQCGAHLAGIHVVSAVRPDYRSDYYVIGEKAIRALIVERKAADEAATSCSPALRGHIREARSPCRIPGDPSRWA